MRKLVIGVFVLIASLAGSVKAEDTISVGMQFYADSSYIGYGIWGCKQELQKLQDYKSVLGLMDQHKSIPPTLAAKFDEYDKTPEQVVNREKELKKELADLRKQMKKLRTAFYSR